jgi:streptomycin 6-kinase
MYLRGSLASGCCEKSLFAASAKAIFVIYQPTTLRLHSFFFGGSKAADARITAQAFHRFYSPLLRATPPFSINLLYLIVDGFHFFVM